MSSTTGGGVDSTGGSGSVSSSSGEGVDASGDPAGVTVSGVVHDGPFGDGPAAVGASVTLLLPPGAGMPQTTTAADGSFSFSGIAPDQVAFVVIAPTPKVAVGAVFGVEIGEGDLGGLQLFRFPSRNSQALEVELMVSFNAGTGAIVGYATTPIVEFTFTPPPETGSSFAYDAGGAAVLGDSISEWDPPVASNFNLAPAMPETHTVVAAREGLPCAPVGPNNPPILADHISYVAFDCG